MPRIRTLDGDKPHPSYRGWAGFLKTCEVRGKARGVVFYGKTNCNFLLFPDGTLILNYGFYGRALLEEVRKKGPDRVLARLRKSYQCLQRLLGKV